MAARREQGRGGAAHEAVGPGSRGLVAARVSSSRILVEGEQVSHVFNVVHGSDGIHFIDVPNGSANFNAYDDFYPLRTQ